MTSLDDLAFPESRPEGEFGHLAGAAGPEPIVFGPFGDDPPEAFEPWARRQIEKIAYGLRNTQEEIVGIRAHLDAQNVEAVPEETIDDVVLHAGRQGWPIVRCGRRCGRRCGFIATAPADPSVGDTLAVLLHAHKCAGPPAPRPALTRLVVGCVTAITILIILGLVVENLTGVK